MKNLCKKISLLALITFGFQAANAQITYGVKAGAGTSNTTLIHGVSKNRIGFVGGGFAEIPLTYKNNLHYLQVEVLYTNQGEFSKQSESASKKYKAFLNYINIPIMYKYFLSDADADFFLEAGPQLGFLVSKNFEIGPEIEDGSENSFDLALAAGIGFSLERKYEVNFRYSYGMTDSYKTFNGNSGSGVNRSSLLSLQLAYKF